MLSFYWRGRLIMFIAVVACVVITSMLFEAGLGMWH